MVGSGREENWELNANCNDSLILFALQLHKRQISYYLWTSLPLACPWTLLPGSCLTGRLSGHPKCKLNANAKIPPISLLPIRTLEGRAITGVKAVQGNCRVLHPSSRGTEAQKPMPSSSTVLWCSEWGPLFFTWTPTPSTPHPVLSSEDVLPAGLEWRLQQMVVNGNLKTKDKWPTVPPPRSLVSWESLLDSSQANQLLNLV